MKTNFYIDAFNLYYGSLKKTPCRWLNLEMLFQKMFPNNQINKIKYFTALVKPWSAKSKKHIRQQVYLRALQTLKSVELIYGHYLTHEVTMPLAKPTKTQQVVRVIKTEEKGSDVNLAVHLLNDAYKNDFEVAVVVSNDSDLVEPIKIVKNDIGKIVGVVNPHKKMSFHLKQEASFIRSHIRKGLLQISQFPNILKDTNGQIHKPKEW